MSGDIRFDDRHWPLVIVTFEGAASRDVFDRYLERMESYLQRKERHCYLLDARDGAMLGSAERTAQGEWLKGHKADLARYSVATGLVVRSAAVRFMLSAIYLIQAPVVPTESFTSIDDAHAWLKAQMEKEGLSIVPRSVLKI